MGELARYARITFDEVLKVANDRISGFYNERYQKALSISAKFLSAMAQIL
jgi:hypothetical protein